MHAPSHASIGSIDRAVRLMGERGFCTRRATGQCRPIPMKTMTIRRSELKRRHSRCNGLAGCVAWGRTFVLDNGRTIVILGVVLSAAEVKALRSRLHMSRAQFARLCGVDSRTVVRWETPDGPRPTGAAQAVMAAIQEKLDSDPGSVKRVVKFLAGAAAVGGLAYVMLKLLGTINGSSGEEE